MSIRKKRPIIPSSTVIIISSVDVKNNIILSALTGEFINKYPDVATYKLISDKDKHFEMAFSSAMLDKYFKMLKTFITESKSINQHDVFDTVSVNIRLMLESLDDNFYLTKEIELNKFQDVFISDSFINITMLLKQLLFFNLDDDISNLNTTKLYNSRKDISEAFVEAYKAEKEQSFQEPLDDNLIATTPSQKDFSDQNSKSVYIPAFSIKGSSDENNDNEDDSDEKYDEYTGEDGHESDDSNDDSKKEIIEGHDKKGVDDTDDPNLKGKGNQDDKDDSNSNIISLDELLKNDMPFVPEHLISRLKKHDPKYLFDVNDDSLNKYADIKEAIKFGRFDAQQYLVSYNNSFKNNANTYIKKATSDYLSDCIAEITEYIKQFNEDIRIADEKANKDLSNNDDIKRYTNSYFKKHFVNDRKPELYKRRDEVKAYKEKQILKKANLEIEEMKKDVDDEFEEKVNNAFHMAHSQAETIANEKMNAKQAAKNKLLLDNKKKLSSKLLNDIQSIYNKFNIRVDKISYVMFKEFNRQLERKQPILVQNISTLIEKQTTLNESVTKMYELRAEEDFDDNPLKNNNNENSKSKLVERASDNPKKTSYKDQWEKLKNEDVLNG